MSNYNLLNKCKEVFKMVLTTLGILKAAGVLNVAKKAICEEHVSPVSAYNVTQNVKEFVDKNLGNNDSACSGGAIVDSVSESADCGSIFDIFDLF